MTGIKSKNKAINSQYQLLLTQANERSKLTRNAKCKDLILLMQAHLMSEIVFPKLKRILFQSLNKM